LLAGSVSAGEASSLPLRNLGKGAFSGIQQAREEVIRTREEWARNWSLHAAGGKASERIPEVDFSKEVVILATLGRQRTGGHAITVVKAEELGGKLRVSIARTKPKPGSMALQALTAPFHFVAVPRSDCPPEFVETQNP
jgi:hypothetical protein